MPDTKALKKMCAGCEKLDYAKCKLCSIYKLLNAVCYFCGNIMAVNLLARSTSKGLTEVNVCDECFVKLV